MAFELIMTQASAISEPGWQRAEETQIRHTRPVAKTVMVIAMYVLLSVMRAMQLKKTASTSM